MTIQNLLSGADIRNFLMRDSWYQSATKPYRIYSINRPGRLLNFWTLRVGAYSRWALIWGWALIKFSPFSASEVCLFCNKTINANNKTRRSNKARFLYNTLKKTPSSGQSLIRIYSLKWVGWGWALIWVWLGGGGGGRLLTFSAFRMDAYSRWMLIWGWALIRINTVSQRVKLC